jgi:hypothetical protein
VGFSADWLSLREPADAVARDQTLLRRAITLAGTEPVIMDMGCGTGSTVRALGLLVPSGTAWRLVDNDQTLLERALRTTGPAATGHLVDLDRLSEIPFRGLTLVTASALLDLVTEDWLQRLAARLQVPFYAALSYNGQMHWYPAEPDDQRMVAAFNRHQLGDKGLGAALGPTAVDAAHRVFRAAGFSIESADSSWRLGPESTLLQQSLVEGIALAAHEAGEPEALAWGETRAGVAAETRCVIGHTDILVIPPSSAGSAP